MSLPSLDIKNILNSIGNIEGYNWGTIDNFPQILIKEPQFTSANTDFKFEIGKYYTAFINGKHVVCEKVNPLRYFGKYIGVEEYDMTSDQCECERICYCKQLKFIEKYKFEGISCHCIPYMKVYHYYSNDEIKEYKLIFQEYIL